MKYLTLNFIPEKWKWNSILTIGGLLIGAGIADCMLAINQLDLNQIARGLTIFSAGLTIIVVIDNNKTQKDTEKTQQEMEVQLERVEHQLLAIQQSQKATEKQLLEIKELLHQSNT